MEMSLDFLKKHTPEFRQREVYLIFQSNGSKLEKQFLPHCLCIMIVKQSQPKTLIIS